MLTFPAWWLWPGCWSSQSLRFPVCKMPHKVAVGMGCGDVLSTRWARTVRGQPTGDGRNTLLGTETGVGDLCEGEVRCGQWVGAFRGQAGPERSPLAGSGLVLIRRRGLRGHQINSRRGEQEGAEILSVQKSHQVASLFCSTAIYNFQGSGAPQLSLQIGDTVRIQETCGGESLTQATLGGQDLGWWGWGALSTYPAPPALSWKPQLCVLCLNIFCSH